MVTLKSQSKRQSLGHKYKVVKKVKEHHRKARKLAKKAHLLTRPSHQRSLEPKIPNSCPFKKELVEAVLAGKKAKADARVAKVEAAKQARLTVVTD